MQTEPALRMLIRAGMALIVLVVAALLAVYRDPQVWLARGAAARAQAALWKDGVPRSPAELQAPLPPASRNAAPLYQKMTRVLAARPLSTEALSLLRDQSRWDSYGPRQISELRQVVADQQDLISLAQEAVRRPECVFKRNWSLGLDTPTPEYQAMRQVCWLLTARSYLLSREGRYHDAVTAQAQVLTIARHLAAEPKLIGDLVSIACDSVALGGMQRILQSAGPNTAIDRAVGRAVEAGHPSFNMRRVLGGEVNLFLPSLHKIVDRKPDLYEKQARKLFGTRTSDGNNDPINSQLEAAMEAPWMEDMHRLILAASRPDPERLTLFKRVSISRDRDHSPFLTLRNDVIQTYARVAPFEAEAHARERVTVASADILAYRAQHGKFPERLQDAVSRPSLDPFTGRTLLYRREPNGFVVYSVGETGLYTGGWPGIRIDSKEAGFRYPLRLRT